ncbi:hypothetical protein Xekk_01435 [Xenorhabdus sp. KK7.4]|nr:hypothetical protein Xekk_01435 [Xenorhabdus sp. KK7.4]
MTTVNIKLVFTKFKYSLDKEYCEYCRCLITLFYISIIKFHLSDHYKLKHHAILLRNNR